MDHIPSLTNSWVQVPTEDCFVPGGLNEGLERKSSGTSVPSLISMLSIPEIHKKNKQTSVCPAGSKVFPHGRDSETLELS